MASQDVRSFFSDVLALMGALVEHISDGHDLATHIHELYRALSDLFIGDVNSWCKETIKDAWRTDDLEHKRTIVPIWITGMNAFIKQSMVRDHILL